MNKPTIDLIWTNPFGVIMLRNSGVLYTNQTAGLACQHPEAEGIFVPLEDGAGKPTRYVLHQHFRGSWYALTDADANIVDGALQKGNLGFIRANRNKLSESTEAWVHVTVDVTASGLFHDFDTHEGILTWENSD